MRPEKFLHLCQRDLVNRGMTVPERVCRKGMKVSVFAALLIVAILTMAAATALAAESRHRSHPPRHAVTAPAPPARIACTQLGCHPIPAVCRPVPQLTWDDLPTGFDAIDCPPGVSPLR